jgi:molybdopterin synthase catalytic subunit
MFSIRVQSDDFDLAAEQKSLASVSTNIGAIVAFTGLCRDESGLLEALELEHYPGMAEAEMSRVLESARARWPLDGATLIHRYGKVVPGDNIVLVITTSRHRQAAFEAAEFLMDYLKTRAPFWKKEHRKDGSTGAWIEARDKDDSALERWSNELGSNRS